MNLHAFDILEIRSPSVVGIGMKGKKTRRYIETSNLAEARFQAPPMTGSPAPPPTTVTIAYM